MLPQMQRGSGANLPCLLQPGSWESPEWLELSLGHCVLENHLKNIPESLEMEELSTMVVSEYSFPRFLCVCFKICVAAQFLK